MKSFILLPAIFLFFFFYNTANYSASSHKSPGNIDSNIIIHKLDGLVTEWPAGKFSTDEETGIQYAMDNNAENLYLALNIPGQGSQMRIMRRGMNLFIDLKGKKKEGRGIEFPLKTENTDINDVNALQGTGKPAAEDIDPSTARQRTFDMKKMRMTMAINLVYLRYFGFGSGDPVVQDLKAPGSISVAFNWDSTDVMHIEYLVPLKMLGEIASLNEKNISVGWKINAFEGPAGKGPDMGGTHSGEGSFSGGHSGRHSFGGGRSNGGGAITPADKEKMLKAQSFWTNYTLNIPVALKGF